MYDQDNGCSGGDRSPSSSDWPSGDWERERAVCALEFGLSRERERRVRERGRQCRAPRGFGEAECGAVLAILSKESKLYH